MAAIGIGVSVAVMTDAQAMQLGIGATVDAPAYAIRAQIFQPSRIWNGALGRAYWVGTTLRDGTFMQIGYLDHGDNSGPAVCRNGEFSWFVTVIEQNGKTLGNMYNIGDCGLTGSPYFKIESSPDQLGGGAYDWKTYVNGNATNAPVQVNYSPTFDRARSLTMSEVVDTGNVDPSSTPLPTVTYGPAMEVKLSDGSWTSIANTQVITSLGNTGNGYACPPYFLQVNATDNITIGNDGSAPPRNCYAYGDTAW